MRKVFPPIITILLTCGILFFLGLGNRGLWVPDETRYVAVAKEIVDSGDWITLRLNGVIYHEKPPVFFWLISIFSVLFGKFSEFSARFPSAIAGLGCALVTYLFAQKLFNKTVALLSSLILITSLAYLGASRWVILDPILTFFAVSAIYLFYVGLIQQNKRLIAYVFAFALMALGTLTKGPVGFILPLLVIIIYASFEKKLRSFFTKECLLGFLLFLLIILSWLIPSCLKGGEAYAKELLLKQIFGRYFKAFSHKEPLYFYFVRFPAEFLPWTLFLPSATAFLLKNKIKEANVKFIFIWFATIFLFFTLSASKNDLYILPAYPAASMAVAYYWENRLRKKWQLFIYVVASVIIFNTILTYFILPHFDKYKSTKYFSQNIAKYLKPNQQLMTFQTSPVHWLYYCNRRRIEEIDDYNELNSYLKSNERVFCIIENNKHEEFKRSYKVDSYVLDSTRFGRKKTFAIISNKVK